MSHDDEVRRQLLEMDQTVLNAVVEKEWEETALKLRFLVTVANTRPSTVDPEWEQDMDAVLTEFLRKFSHTLSRRDFPVSRSF